MGRILTWHDKYEDSYFRADSDAQLHEAALTVLAMRIDYGYLFYPDTAEDRAKAIYKAQDGKAALDFLNSRNEHEYERISITETR